MRKSARALLLAVVALLGSLGLTIAAVFSAALSFGAIALIVPGTGTPNANTVTNYMENARDRFLQNTACGGGACTDSDLVGINYPASFFPLVIFSRWCRSGPQGCDKWDESVDQGADGGPLGPGLTSALTDALAAPGTPGQRDIIVFGYSQGGAVVSKVLRDYNWQEGDKERIEVVTIGGIENPDGGLWQRLAFLRYIPFLDITFAPPMPVDPEIKTTTFGFQYDPVVYAPRYWGNPLAMLNALAGFDNVHGYYLSPNGNDGDTPSSLPYGYTDETLAEQLDCSANPGNCRYDDAGNAYIMIPATSLPMYNFVLDQIPAPFKPLIEPLIKLVTPVTKLFVDLGYDWSGNPGVPTPLSILPFNPFAINPITFPIQVVQAIVQGIQDAIGGAAGSQAPEVTTLAARSSGPQPSAKLEETSQTEAVADEAAALSDNAGKKSDAAAEPVVTQPVSSDDADAATEQAAADAADQAAKDAADKASAEQTAVDNAAAAEKEAAAKAEKDAAAKAEKEAADKTAADAAKDAAKDAADAVRQQAADNAKAAAGNDKPAASDGTATAATATATDTPAAAADEKAAA